MIINNVKTTKYGDVLISGKCKQCKLNIEVVLNEYFEEKHFFCHVCGEFICFEHTTHQTILGNNFWLCSDCFKNFIEIYKPKLDILEKEYTKIYEDWKKHETTQKEQT
ncbi:MAG: hypothetical protein BWY04_01364 [candidate division CPR1 bacterium ADurb.Bin160]|uniref:Uncharacterized protein n=1 Tax=candidate division CPR1 bacterium ADurb.Bin160 TaxID=1852826 RepID=A0A1V5ZJH8_9BACT|nr:MAG: hypothetical protein BWY04_01364 [candidate division CPR1 bacterium ADurb.Bin160]